ncbi:hypothetical protein MNEG_16209, partial [Monoraphidium neglectum]
DGEGPAFDWDWSCPWSAWAHIRDPIGLLELDVVWDRRPLPLGRGGGGGGGAGEAAGPLRAGLGAVRASWPRRGGADDDRRRQEEQPRTAAEEEGATEGEGRREGGEQHGWL